MLGYIISYKNYYVLIVLRGYKPGSTQPDILGTRLATAQKGFKVCVKLLLDSDLCNIDYAALKIYAMSTGDTL